MNKKLVYPIGIILLILLVLFLSFGKEVTKQNYINITGSEAVSLVNSGALVVDVRTQNEYNVKHIKGAINVPYDQIETLKDKQINKNDEIILYCQSGSRAEQAARKLINLGYTKVYNLGALSSWHGETE